MATPVSDLHASPFGAAPRPLTEDVLQSAEEAVMADPPSLDPLQGDHSGPTAALSGTVRSAPATDRLIRLVAEKPVQSALIALAVGALTAAVLKRALYHPQRR